MYNRFFLCRGSCDGGKKGDMATPRVAPSEKVPPPHCLLPILKRFCFCEIATVPDPQTTIFWLPIRESLKICTVFDGNLSHCLDFNPAELITIASAWQKQATE